MKPEEKRQLVEDALKSENPDALYMDGHDIAIIGIAQKSQHPPVVAYSEAQIIDNLMSWGMCHEEATEYYYFNIAGAWLGPEMPIIVTELSSL